jgi:outer membrane protein OmpA-like peptidoglycan-associated protein
MMNKILFLCFTLSYLLTLSGCFGFDDPILWKNLSFKEGILINASKKKPKKAAASPKTTRKPNTPIDPPRPLTVEPNKDTEAAIRITEEPPSPSLTETENHNVNIASQEEKVTLEPIIPKEQELNQLGEKGVNLYLNELEKDLRTRLQGNGIRIERNGYNLIINISNLLIFPSNSSNIKRTFIRPLNAITETLNQYAGTNIEISGHTNNQGVDSHNLRLTQQRAEHIASHFITQGIAADRLYASGHGGRRPIASNMTKIGRLKNSRIELHIYLHQQL